ncbi:N-acetyltransferase [Demequina sp. B12]|uniref:GNAT family N-acetyltransferase n=1 Tax=Demequina sp. B12 TaxID=2992757 RepID=UPI00237BDC27|nr:GNAT family N-acetyltransferase [Demequina sp. B12]MDE0572805.1 N-acetyltransferase [Demequina sp. B12]
MTLHSDSDVVRSDASSRYEYSLNGDLLGFIEFVVEGPRTILTHTEVPEEFHGTGVARELAAGAMADLATRDTVVVPACPYLARYLRRCDDPGFTIEWPAPRSS